MQIRLLWNSGNRAHDDFGLGLVSSILLVVALLIFSPWWQDKYFGAAQSESAAVDGLRGISALENQYAAEYPGKGFASELSLLPHPSDVRDPYDRIAGLLAGKWSGYKFAIVSRTPDADGIARRYNLTAVPTSAVLDWRSRFLHRSIRQTVLRPQWVTLPMPHSLAGAARVGRKHDPLLALAIRKCSYLRMPWDFWLIFFVFGVVLPWRGRERMKKLLAMSHVSSIERLVLYASTIAFQWLAVAIVSWRVWAHGYSAQQLGLLFHDRTKLLIAGIVGAALIGSLQWLNLRRVSRIPPESRGPVQAIAERILPQTGVELPPYLALAITAGLCEEFLYRGFAMAALTHAALSGWLVVLISSILFGLAHSYQGRGGIVMTFLVGLALGASRLAYNSLVPAVFWHSAIDIAAGLAGRRYLKRRIVDSQPDRALSNGK